MTRQIFDIDIHTIPENLKKNEPEHKHYDVRFLLKAPTEDFVVSEESNSLKWVDEAGLAKMAAQDEISPAMQRMMQKWKSRK